LLLQTLSQHHPLYTFVQHAHAHLPADANYRAIMGDADRHTAFAPNPNSDTLAWLASQVHRQTTDCVAGHKLQQHACSSTDYWYKKCLTKPKWYTPLLDLPKAPQQAPHC
jgi:hypothetical protein